MRIFFTPTVTGTPDGRSPHAPRASLPLETYGAAEGLPLDEEFVSPNNGNVIHAESAAKLFACDRDLSAVGRLAKMLGPDGEVNRAEIAAIEANFDLVVMNYANVIRGADTFTPAIAKQTDNAFAGLAAFLENSTIPVAVMGMGLQDEIAPGPDALLPGMMRAFRAIEARGCLFTVRGERTAAFLHAMGIGSAQALGCPSLFVNPWAVERMRPPATRWRKWRVTTAGRMNAAGNPTGRFAPVRAIGARFETDYTFQNDLHRIAERIGAADLPYNSESGEVDGAAVGELLRKLTKARPPFARYWYFRTPASWRAYAATRDVYLGDRFHGGVAFLQAGRPAGFIQNDLRVAEMAGFFDLPVFSSEEVMARGARDVVAEVASEGAIERFRARYWTRYEAFEEACAAFGLKTKYGLWRGTLAAEEGAA